MADTDSSTNNNEVITSDNNADKMDIAEPESKKRKVEAPESDSEYKLEERLNGILCCAVCLDLPPLAVFQCTNGHLMCASCMAHLLADSRLKDETATCPNCRCEISKSLCIRNLAVEKAISELPASCQYCNKLLPRSQLAHHEHDQCLDRFFGFSRWIMGLVQCRFQRIGCSWRGPFHEKEAHELSCTHPKKPGEEVMGALEALDAQRELDMKLFKQVYDLLSFEKVTFSDLQMRPYRTDDFIPRLYYETSRFSALGNQWVVKAFVSENIKNPAMTCTRFLTYQLVCKSKLQNPIRLHYLALRGPFSDLNMRPRVYDFEFNQDNVETDKKEFPIVDSNECNKILAAKNISFRLILFQVQK